MAREIELSTLDLRYESYRMRDPRAEEKLLGSVGLRGIENPLRGVLTAGGALLFDGFKRVRCARKLGIGMAPFVSLATGEAPGIVALMSASPAKPLNLLEQAYFVNELHEVYKKSPREIAEDLKRGVSWVTMRLGVLRHMPQGVRKQILRGAFPLYSYLYSLRPFMRMRASGTTHVPDAASKVQAEEFVEAVSGKKLSVREIECLAHGFFRGPPSLREQIARGNVELPLRRIKEAGDDPEGCSPFERGVLKDLERLGKYMHSVMGKAGASKLRSRAFHVQSLLLTSSIISKQTAFFDALRRLHDRSANA